MFSYITRALLLLFTISIFTNLIYGQSSITGGSITGTVRDQQGGMLLGAVVTVRQVDTNLARSLQVGERGFNFLQMPPGKYQVSVEAEGFIAQQEMISLALGTTALVEFTLNVAGSSEIIEIRSGNAFIDDKTESGTNIERERINNLPINRRNFLDFTVTVARATPDRLPQQGVLATSGLSINGQSSRFNSITIDGLDNNDLSSGTARSTFSQEAVQEFQVVTDNYTAEFGRALGGIINIVTRGGSNQYRATIFSITRTDETSARDVFSATKPGYKQYQFGATLGGPIKRDRLFFFTSFERLSIGQSNIVTISDAVVAAARRDGFQTRNGPVPFSIGTTSALARIDAQLTSGNLFTARYNFGGNYNGSIEPFGGKIDATAAGIQRLDDNNIALQNIYTNAALALVNETRFLYNRREQKVRSATQGPTIFLNSIEESVTFGGNSLLPQERLLNGYQIVNNVSLVRGRHQIKFGVDAQFGNSVPERTPVTFGPDGAAAFTSIDFARASGIPGLPFFTGLQAFDPSARTPQQLAFLNLLTSLAPAQFPGFPAGVPFARLALPVVFAQGFGSVPLDNRGRLFAAFFQDNLRLRPNLLVKAGIRYDINRSNLVPENNGNVSPRIALAYRPARFERLNIRAAYGLFFAGALAGPSGTVRLSASDFKLLVLPFPFSVLPYAQPGHRFPRSESLPPGVNFIPQLSIKLVYDQNLRNSYAQQANYAIDYLIDNNTVASINYTYVRGIKLLSNRNINPIVRPIPNDPVRSAVTGRIDATEGDINQFESAYDSYYHAFTLLLNRRFSQRFSLLANYTFSKTIDNFTDFVRNMENSNSQLNPGGERGLSIQDVRSRFVASGLWDISYTKNPWLRDFQLSTILTLNTGRPYNLLAGVDLNMDGDNPPGDRPAGIARNAGITPGFANIDVRLLRQINFRDEVKLEGFVEVFNLFNRVNISDFNRTFPPDAQGRFNLPPQRDGRFIVPRERYLSAFAPRQVQFGLKLIF